MTIEFKGLKELNAKLEELSKIAHNEAVSELEDIALDLGSKASDSAPVLNGDLRGDLARPKKVNELSWKVGSSLPYARRQHEEEYKHPRGGSSKFLEKPFRENVNKYTNAIGEAIGRKLR
ncbi:HK97 gp10 family phage protein [Terrisporobacter vanillatitrophus]|uniref:HK97 gp10 family phage protein n=1 Tax=Terrisporobacter vanillatitrophus TaxID=3058402 RepID=UPI0033698AE4